MLLASVTVLVLFTIVAGAALALVLALAVPFLAVGRAHVRAGRRAREFEEQLPEILDSLSASLRAGHGFDYALQTIDRRRRRSGRDASSGGSSPRCTSAARWTPRCADLGERVQSEDLLFVLDAIMVQRQVGGSLAELFELVSETVRSRE